MTPGARAPGRTAAPAAPALRRTVPLRRPFAPQLRPQPRHQQQRFARDLAAHLRLADLTVDEVDRDLLDAQAGARHAERHLDLERIALRRDPGQVELPQRRGVEAAEAGG